MAGLSGTPRKSVKAENLAADVTNGIVLPNIVWDSFNAHVDPRYEFGKFTRWHAKTGVTRIADATNPFSGYSLLFPGTTASANFGKNIHFGEAGIQPGEYVTFGALVNAPAGTFGMSVGFYTSADVLIGSNVTGPNKTFTGTPQIITVGDAQASNQALVPATAAYAKVFLRRASGTSDLTVYTIWGNKGQYLGAMPNPGFVDTFFKTGEQIVWDPFFKYVSPGEDISAQTGWFVPACMQLQPGTNTLGGRTVRFLGTSASTTTGKRIALKDINARVGDTLQFAAIVTSAGPGSWSARAVFQDAARANVGSTFNGTTTAVTSEVPLYTPEMTVPAGATSIVFYISRPSGSSNLDILAMWGAKNGTLSQVPLPSTAPVNIWQSVAEARQNGGAFGRHLLRDWRTAIAKVKTGVGDAVITFIGDSWFERKSIVEPFKNLAQTKWGDAGPGWVDFYFTDQTSAYNMGWTLVKAGTWTGVDSTSAAKGLADAHMSTVDIATPAKLTLASTGNINKIVLHYYKQTGGGDFRWRVDAGAWTTVSTDVVTAGMDFVTISGLSSAAHTLEVEAVVAGSQAITLTGAELIKTGPGVRVNKAGNGGSKVSDWLLMGTTFEASLAQTASNAVVVSLGTNDKTSNIVPETFYADMTTLVGRIRTALPYTTIVLMAPGDTGDVQTYLSQNYAAVMRQVAVETGCVLISIIDEFGTNAEAQARLVMDLLAVGNSRHVTDLGGYVLGSRIFEVLEV